MTNELAAVLEPKITSHTAVDYELVARLAPLIIDTRGVYRSPLKNVTKA